MQRKNLFGSLAACAFWLAFSPWPARAEQAPHKIEVVATFSILADLTRQIGGDKVEVTALVGPNGDVHVYQPSPNDAKRLAQAGMIVVNGLKLEGWIDRLIAASGAKAPVVVAARGVVPRVATGDQDENHSGIDPHAWQSVANAKIYVANILAGLIDVDAADAETFRARAKAFEAELDQLDLEVRQAVEKIPARKRKIITTHDAFGYFGQAYGFAFLAPQGLSTETEPSAADVARLINQIKREKAPAVFLENVSDPRMMQRIAAETGAKIGGELFSDQLSPPDGPAGTYIDMMRHNIRELTKALAR